MTVAGSLRPKMHIVSRRLRDLLVPQGFSGIDLVPCLRKGATYSDNDRLLQSRSPALDEQADFFQLIVREKVLGYANVGAVALVFTQCPTCRCMFGCFFESTPTFRAADLGETDFQISDGYETSNMGTILTAGENIIVSARVIRFLLESKIKGLFRYLTDPPIKHGIVEVAAA